MNSNLISLSNARTSQNAICSKCKSPPDSEIAEFLRSVIHSIAKITMRASKATWGGIVSFVSWLNKKMQEGAEIHNRQTQMLDERYMQNFYTIRAL